MTASEIKHANAFFDWTIMRDKAIDVEITAARMDLRVLDKKLRINNPVKDQAAGNEGPRVELVTLAEIERRHILSVFHHCETQGEAAAILGLDKSTMSRRLQEFGVRLKREPKPNETKNRN